MARLAKRLLVLSVVAAGVSFARTSDAFDGPWWGGWNMNGFGCGYGASLYNAGKIPVPPYYAIHPPVYYGHRVRQTYGDSPYAQPPSRWALQSSTPVIIINPFVPSTANQMATDHAPPMRSTIIENPYFE